MFWISFAVLYLGLYLIPTWLPGVLAGSGLPLSVAGPTLPRMIRPRRGTEIIHSSF